MRPSPEVQRLRVQYSQIADLLRLCGSIEPAALAQELRTMVGRLETVLLARSRAAHHNVDALDRIELSLPALVPKRLPIPPVDQRVDSIWQEPEMELLLELDAFASQLAPKPARTLRQIVESCVQTFRVCIVQTRHIESLRNVVDSTIGFETPLTERNLGDDA